MTRNAGHSERSLQGPGGERPRAARSLNTQQYANSRPYLYHLTDSANVSLIKRAGTLSPAIEVMRRAGRLDLLRVRRREHQRLVIGKTEIMVRDQAPLHRGSVALRGGFSFEDVIEAINRREMVARR